MSKEDKIKAIVDGYSAARPGYASYCQALKPILETLLGNQGLSYQVVTERAKDVLSFETKVRSGTPKVKTFDEMKDLAGCRIIFYLESDANKFVETIRHEFDVVHEENKVSASSYNAYHMTVKLKSPRLDLPEYKQFKDLKCEIQLTTVLFHSWSELNHDLVYKDKDSLSEFDPAGFEALKDELETIMRDHIKVATRKFEVVSQKAQRLREGKMVFDTEFLSRIPSFESNNEIYENLRLLDQYVGEFADDKTPEDIDIINLLQATIAKAKTNKPKPLKSIFGTVPGKTYVDVAIKCIEILDRKIFTYNHYERVFNTLLDLHKVKQPAIKKKVEEVMQHLSRYDYHVLKQVGYYFQKELVKLIEKFSAAQIKRNFSPIMKAMEGVLSVELSGESFDPKTQALTIIQGGLTPTDDLKEIRSNAIALLKKIYQQTKDTEDRKKIIYVLSRTTVLPGAGNYTDELTQIVIQDAQKILQFYADEVASTAEDAILMEMEEDCAWLFKRFGADKIPQLDGILDVLSKNESYQVYRTLCGYSGRLATDRTWAEEAAQIDKNIDAYITQINDNAKELWFSRIIAITKEYEPGGRALIHFNNFLGKMAAAKPKFALELIDRHRDDLSQVMRPLLMGLLDSNMKSEAKQLIERLTKDGKHLNACALSLWNEHTDIVLLQKILAAAIKTNDIQAAIGVIQALVNSYDKVDKPKAKALIVEAIGFLKQHKVNYWMSYVWHMKTLQGLLADFSSEEIGMMLENLVADPRLNHEAEDILAAIAQQYPVIVIDFLKARVGVQTKRRRLEYDAIPYHVDSLGEALRSDPEVVFNEVSKWYDEKNPLYHWEANRFLASIFPSLDDPLKDKLSTVIDEGDEDKVKKIVVDLLRNYDGNPLQLDLCKEIVIKFGKPLHSNVMLTLTQTGVVSGEYGLRDAYKKKKQDVAVWENDENPNIKAFYKEYTKYLDQRIETEQKRADDDIEFLKAGL